MVGRRRHRPAAWLLATALAAPLLIHGQAPAGLAGGPTGGSKFPAGGVTVPVPGHPECVLTVESWETGSFLLPDGQARPPFSIPMRGRWLTPGTRDTDEQAGRDEREIANQLALALNYSPDMVNKVTKACTLRGSIAVRLVRDDPFVNVGATVMNSNLVLIDMGDVAKTVAQVATDHPVGTPDLTRYEAPVQVGRAFTYGLLAHEIDHLQENGDGTHSDPGKGAAFDDAQGGAVRDENLVLKELKLGFQRPTYINIQNGRSLVLYQSDMTSAVFDPGKAIFTPTRRANGVATEQDFVVGDAGIVEGIEDRCCGCDGTTCHQVLTETRGAPEAAPTSSSTVPDRVDRSPRLRFHWFRDDVDGLSTDRSLDEYVSNAAEKILARIAAARLLEGVQKMGGSALTFKTSGVDLTRRDLMPSWQAPGRPGDAFAALTLSPGRAPWLARGRSPARAVPSPSSGQAGRPASPPSVLAVFTSLGRSSGTAFRMDVVHDSPGPIRALGDGFVLEPLASVTPQEIQRDLARLKGSRASATIDAYCLEFAKTPPALDTIYRLVPPGAATKHANLPAIMAASKRLQSSRRLNPDSDAEEYFHAIRQWVLWSEEQGWRTEDAFGRAFLSHARKNLAAAGRPWTGQIEAAIQKIIPNRWRDIEAVRAEAKSPRSAGSGR